jgi:hypothetical protein
MGADSIMPGYDLRGTPVFSCVYNRSTHCSPSRAYVAVSAPFSRYVIIGAHGRFK